MPESATQPQSDTLADTQPADTQPVISEPLLSQEPPRPEAKWRVSRSALLLIGGPLAGALLVWLAISIFRSDPTTPPEATEERAAEPAVATPPAPEAQPAIETSVASSAEAEAQAEPAPAPVAPEPLRQQPDAPLSAVNEVTPKVSQSALNTISGTVRVSVRVIVDNAGAVVDATADDAGPSRYFERLSVDASKKWTFTPANSEEQRTMLVKFNFTREGVTARAEPDEER
jgi:TonB family protein